MYGYNGEMEMYGERISILMFFFESLVPNQYYSTQACSMRVWVQVHIIPHEHFSKDNGSLMGGKAGKVTQVELQEDNPASRSKLLKVLVEKDINAPLFSGCFFDLEKGVKKWLQFKYEQIEFVCHNCRCLGHKRRGCNVSSPVTVASDNGVQFPLFRPWFSTSSTFREVSSSASSFSPFRELPRFVLFGPYRRPLKPVVARNGDGGFSRSSSLDPCGSRRSLMATRRWTVASGKAQQAMWISKSKPDSLLPQFAIFDIKVDVGFDGMRKVPDTLPGLKSTNPEPIECRSLGNVINLNIENVEDPFVHLVGRPTKETFHFGRPETSNLITSVVKVGFKTSAIVYLQVDMPVSLRQSSRLTA
ncbi:hypothetical protein G4B88_002209 [Cannabis sativa]|uniref:Zinc knuckle CX2CX4HX4C domain-containing protein n=1 Tax=Cannabis sativa TaxID=3483 RepID=A0A7J6FZ43_CANSA|nr:hypothetical protein G4B88_002209 [Cannabis sativa]